MPDEYAAAAENGRRLGNSERLRAAVLRDVRAAGGRALVVAQKAVEDYWRQLGHLPGYMELAHHNAVAGRDEWGPGPDRPGVRRLVVVGRTLPRPGDVERIAEALTGAAVSVRASGRYERHAAAIPLADGTFASAEADRHPDPMAEAVRWQICEGELVQIIGRGRGVNRTAADPLDVLVLTDRPLPLAVDETVTWEELMPSPADLMLSQGGVALENSADAARCYPALWSSPDAARQAFHRAGQCVTNPNREFSYGECHALRRATYQRAGARMRPASLAFDPCVMAPDELQGWLEELVGPLARFDLDPEPPPGAPRPGRASDVGAGGHDHQAEPDGPALDGEVGATWPAEPAQRPPATDTVPAGPVTYEAVQAPPDPPEAPQGPIPPEPKAAGLSVEVQQVALLRKRLQLAGLAGRLRQAKPKRTLAIRALDWSDLEAAARRAAELPSAEWWALREGRDEGADAPQPTGSAVADAVRWWPGTCSGLFSGVGRLDRSWLSARSRAPGRPPRAPRQGRRTLGGTR